MKNEKNIICANCIWNKQCESNTPCSFFDDGIDTYSLPDDEINFQIEVKRRAFEIEYQEYIAEYGDGNDKY